MEIKTFQMEDSHLLNGTSLMGYVHGVTREDLEKVFGLPMEYGEGDKVTTEWMFSIDGEIGTLYDWKRYEYGAPEMDEPYDWHVGGKTTAVVKLVTDALRKSGVRIQEEVNA